MQTIRYKTYWSYASRGIKKEDTIDNLVLDIPYLMENTGVIPPLSVLNQVLSTGGDSGGMGPGVTWKPFQIDENEYSELVRVLKERNVDEVRASHPHIRFSRIIVDDDLAKLKNYRDWLRESFSKYKRGS